jgi:hypothetical protein
VPTADCSRYCCWVHSCCARVNRRGFSFKLDHFAPAVLRCHHNKRLQDWPHSGSSDGGAAARECLGNCWSSCCCDYSGRDLPELQPCQRSSKGEHRLASARQCPLLCQGPTEDDRALLQEVSAHQRQSPTVLFSLCVYICAACLRFACSVPALKLLASRLLIRNHVLSTAPLTCTYNFSQTCNDR